MHRILTGCALSCLLFTGCFETEQEFTLNPDGSGKLVHETTVPLLNQLGDQLPETLLAAEARKLILESVGVDAWREVTWRLTDNGRAHLRGTAYFTNLSRLEIAGHHLLKFDWKVEGATATITRRRSDLEKGGDTKPASTDPAETAKELQAARVRMQTELPLLKGMLDGMRHRARFHLPGQVLAASNFKLSPDGVASIELTGTNLIRMYERMLSNESDSGLLLAAWDSSAITPGIEGRFNEGLFGSNAPVVLTCRLRDAPAFDYAAEVATARKETEKVRESLGLGSVAPVLAPPSEGGALNARVVGTRRIVVSDGLPAELRPFGFQRSELSLAVLLEFTNRVLEIPGLSMEPILTDDGATLLPAHRKTGFFCKLSDDGTRAIFELELPTPGPGVRQLRELSGTVEYLVSKGTRDVDLGFDNLRSGSKGTELGAEITGLKPGTDDDETELELTLHLPEAAFISLALMINGTEHPLRKVSWGRIGSAHHFTFRSEVAVPGNGRLVALIHDQLDTIRAPFKIVNVPLSGTE